MPRLFCASTGSPAIMGVSKMPGAMVTTRMRWRASSRAIGSVMAATPPLEAAYAGWLICPSNAATEAVPMMTPRSPSMGSVAAIAAAARRITLKVPTRLIRTTRSKSASGNRPDLPNLSGRCDPGAVDHDPDVSRGGGEVDHPRDVVGVGDVGGYEMGSVSNLAASTPAAVGRSSSTTYAPRVGRR